MKKTLITTSLYIGTFSVAFAGFLFVKIDAAQDPQNVISEISNEKVKSVTSTNQLATYSSDITEKAGTISKDKPHHDTQSADHPKSHSESTNKFVTQRSADNRIRHRDFNNQTPEAIEHNQLYTAEYNDKDTSSNSSHMNTTVMNSYSYSSDYDSYSPDTTVNDSPSVTTTADSYSTTSVSSDNSNETAATDTATDNYTEVISDGSEFLPDGSSQEDLAKSLSKDPRVYSIEDYQQASITCDNSYGAPSAHADLMFKLKGC